MAAYYSEVFYGPSRKADQTFQVKKHRAVKVSRWWSVLCSRPYGAGGINSGTVLTPAQTGAAHSLKLYTYSRWSNPGWAEIVNYKISAPMLSQAIIQNCLKSYVIIQSWPLKPNLHQFAYTLTLTFHRSCMQLLILPSITPNSAVIPPRNQYFQGPSRNVMGANEWKMISQPNHASWTIPSFPSLAAFVYSSHKKEACALGVRESTWASATCPF